jgi:hypothetical protein
MVYQTLWLSFVDFCCFGAEYLSQVSNYLKHHGDGSGDVEDIYIAERLHISEYCMSAWLK